MNVLHRGIKKLSAFLFSATIAVGSVMPNTIPIQAMDNPELDVAVEGSGSVSISKLDSGKTDFAIESNPFHGTFDKDSEIILTCDSNEQVIQSITVNSKERKIDENLKNYEFKLSLTENTDVLVKFENQKEDLKTMSEESEQPKDSESEDKVEIEDTPEDTPEEDPRDKIKNNLSSDGLTIDLTNNTFENQDKQLVQDYINGNTDPYKNLRKEKAEETGLIKYTDGDYFLTNDFYAKYPAQILMFDGCYILDISITKNFLNSSEADAAAVLEELEMQNQSEAAAKPKMKKAARNNAKSGPVRVDSSNRYTLNLDHITPGWWATNNLWGLSNGKYAFCANGDLAAPTPGMTSLTAPVEVDNANLRKALYYGYGGPDNRLDQFGISGAANQIVITNELASQAYIGTTMIQLSTNTMGKWIKANVLDKVLALPDPAGYKVYKVNFSGKGVAWNGAYTDYQNLVYGEYVPTGDAQLQKESANKSISDNNSCYSIAGAEYGVYEDKAATKKKATLTIGADGWSNTVTGIAPGTYYVKEIKAPKGFALDTTVYELVVKSGNKTVLKVADVPQSDPIKLLLTKVDAATGSSKPEGQPSLSGAEFTIKFYPNEDGSGNPARTWLMKTDENGEILLDNDHKISGDDFYKNSEGVATLPLGVVKIQETKAPEGYFLNNDIYTIKITSEGNKETVKTYKAPQVKEQMNEFVLTKVQIGTQTPIQETVFTLKHPDGTTEDIKTNKDGKIHLKGLKEGDYSLKEKSVMDGYEINPNEFLFTVNQNGISSSTDLNGKEMTFDQGDTSGKTPQLVVSDKVSDYKVKLIKINEHDKNLPGAEFTIYEDEDCTKPIETLTTNESGILIFDNIKDRTDYWFKETKAPQGYKIPVDKDGNQHIYKLRAEFIPAQGNFNFYVDDTEFTVNDTDGSIHLEDENGTKVVSITVINYTNGRLPETGSNLTLILTAVGIGLFGIWVLLSNKNRRME